MQISTCRLDRALLAVAAIAVAEVVLPGTANVAAQTPVPETATPAPARRGGRPPPVVLPPQLMPGLQEDGSTLLHNQWSIRPAGDQVELGDFPVNLAVDPSGHYVAVLHAGHGQHEIRVVDLRTEKLTETAKFNEAFYGIAFSADGRTLVCSGGSDEVVRVFAFSDGKLTAQADLSVGAKTDRGVVTGVALDSRGAAVVAARMLDNDVQCVDRKTGAVRWKIVLGKGPDSRQEAGGEDTAIAPNDVTQAAGIAEGEEPLATLWDARRNRIYVSLWGQSAIAVLDAKNGNVTAQWPCGLHPNEMLLSPDGRRLFVSNGGLNSIAVLDTVDGRALEQLSSAMVPGDPPGSTPDSLALSPDGKTLYVANAYNNNIAVFDVSVPGNGKALGFIPTGWFPTSVRVTPDGKKLLVVSGRGLKPKANGIGSNAKWPSIKAIYHGTLGIIDLPPKGKTYEWTLAAWTLAAQRCRPALESTPAADNPIPDVKGGPSPIRYVIYIIKENRTYDQVLGDMSEGNGDSRLCLFGEKITPNHHAIARQFVLLDNFYVNAEVSASGHAWSMGAYATEFVEKTWPVNYDRRGTKVPYPGEGFFAAATPALGDIWDRAAAAGVTYRSYAEFASNGRRPEDPVVTNIPALKGHLDTKYRAWDLQYHDVNRAARFISELHRFEQAGDMPRLQIMRLPADHLSGGISGGWTPSAMVADNDLAVGQVVDAVSHSSFWPQTAIFILEDDAQSGPDHVDAHRSPAFVVSPYTRRHVVDSTPYTTCSMLRTMELILGLKPMSQFDELARPMWASFQAQPDSTPFVALPETVNMEERNPVRGRAVTLSASFDFSKEDLVDDETFNQVIWLMMRGEKEPLPAPVHAAFVRSFLHGDDDGDGDDAPRHR